MKSPTKDQPTIKDKNSQHKKPKTEQQSTNKNSPLKKQKIIEIPKQKQSKSFIQKFKDKHSVISKQGLLKLFQKQPFKPYKQPQLAKQVKLTPKVQSPQQIKNNYQSSLKQKQKSLQKIKIEQIIKARSNRKKSQASVTKSVQLPQLNPKSGKIQKSISTAIHLREKMIDSPGEKAQTDSIPRQMKKVPSSEIKSKSRIDGYNFELDKFALDHLDFLDRFQQRLKKRELTPSPY